MKKASLAEKAKEIEMAAKAAAARKSMKIIERHEWRQSTNQSTGNENGIIIANEMK